MQRDIVCLNGEFLPAAQARLPVADRGFRFGDGVFETIPLVEGVPYQWAFHLARLQRGLRALRIAEPAYDWPMLTRELIARNEAVEGFIRLAVSRGVGSRGYLPLNATPTVVIEHLPAFALPTAPLTLHLSTLRRVPLACLPVNQKLAQGIGSTLALLEAQEQGADDALQLAIDGSVCETASGNLFWVRDGILHTPSLAVGCVEGSSRAALMRLMPVQEEPCGLDALRDVEALAVSNARLGIWPVATLAPLGLKFDVTHPILTQAQAALASDRQAHAQAHRGQW